MQFHLHLHNLKVRDALFACDTLPSRKERTNKISITKEPTAVEDIFAMGDNLGPAKVIHVQQPHLGLKGVLVVDNVATGPSIGGLRMAESYNFV